MADDEQQSNPADTASKNDGGSGGEDPPPPQQERTSIKTAKTIFTSAYLVALYTIAIYLAVMTLAIHQIHQKTSKFQETNGEVHFWLFKKASDFYRLLPDNTKQINTDSQIKEKIKTFISKNTESKINSVRATNEFDSYVNNIIGPVGNVKYKEENPATWMVPKTKYNFSIKFTKNDENKIDNKEEIIKKIDDLYKNHVELFNKNKEIEVELKGLRDLEAAAILQQRVGKEKATKDYIDKYIPASKKQTDQIFMLSMEFGALEDRFICLGIIATLWNSQEDEERLSKKYCAFKSMATTRTEILTLILILIMGGVGGLIHLTQDYLTNNRRATAAYYVFRPVLGILAAFATFILVKAGVHAVSGSAYANGQEGPLSPFFISFLGIISGLMAQASVQNVQVAARNFFRPGNLRNSTRWARADASVNVQELADGANQTDPQAKEKLQAVLDENEDILNDWLSGRHPTPIHAQRAIALWLNRDIRDLFHDTPSHQQAQ